MSAFLDDVGARLVAQGVGVLGSNIFLGSRAVVPSGAGPYLTVSETGGVAPTRIQGRTTPGTRRPTAQVLALATTYQAARAMIEAAYAALDGVYNTTIGTTFYQRIAARQEPTDMGADATGNRVQLVFNIEAEGKF